MTQPQHEPSEPHEVGKNSDGTNAALAASVEALLNEGERAPRTGLEAVRYIGLRVVVVGAAAVAGSIGLNALLYGEFRISWVSVFGAMAICSALAYGQMRRHQSAEANIRETLGLK